MDNDKEHAHQHTFGVYLYVGCRDENKAGMFFDFDSIGKTYFEGFEQKYLNDCEQFKELIPNIENMGDIFFEELTDRLKGTDYNLYQLDIFDNIMSVYQVSDRILLPAVHENDLARMLGN